MPQADNNSKGRHFQRRQSIQPDPTESDINAAYGRAFGLTPVQQRAAILLASGKGIQEVAEAVGVHRSTIWEWQKLPTFSAFMNSFLRDYRADVRAELFALQTEAVAALRRALVSPNDGVAFKAAQYVMERAQEYGIGRTSPQEIVRSESTKGFDASVFEVYDVREYNERCKQLGIDP